MKPLPITVHEAERALTEMVDTWWKALAEKAKNDLEKLVMDTENILEEANRLVNGDRQNSYGSAKENMTVIAKYWTV